MDWSHVISAGVSAIAGGILSAGLLKYMAQREVERLDRIEASVNRTNITLATISERLGVAVHLANDVKTHDVKITLLERDVLGHDKHIKHVFEMIRHVQESVSQAPQRLSGHGR